MWLRKKDCWTQRVLCVVLVDEKNENRHEIRRRKKKKSGEAVFRRPECEIAFVS